VLIKLDFCMPPIILGLILSGTVEENLRRTLVISDGNLSIFLEHPIAMVLLVIAVISLLSPIIMKAVKKRSAQKQAQ
jgi:putative tricarboxylic transport membrane protein